MAEFRRPETQKEQHENTRFCGGYGYEPHTNFLFSDDRIAGYAGQRWLVWRFSDQVSKDANKHAKLEHTIKSVWCLVGAIGNSIQIIQINAFFFV